MKVEIAKGLDMYRASKYLIEVPLDSERIIVYSTLTTSLIVLTRDEYEKVFVQHSFEDNETCDALHDMGMLVVEDESQEETLAELRRGVLNGDDGISGIMIAPTMDCNARCYYCFENGARRGTMSTETADAVADFIIEHCPGKKLYISWFGGEPLLVPGIIDRITYALKAAGNDVESTITTNGILLTDEIIRRFDDWGTYRVQISVDGIGDQYNKTKRLQGIEGDPFEKIVENIKRTLDSGISVHLRINYRSTNRKSIEEGFDFFNGKFGTYENLSLYGAPLDLPDEKGYSEFDESEGNLYLDVLKMSLDNGYEDDELNFRDGVSASEENNIVLGNLLLSPFPAPCMMINKWRFAVDDRGLLYKCQKHLGQERFSCGSVFEGIDANDCYRYFSTDELHDERCENCAIFPICHGGCNANRLMYGDKFACPPSKTIMPKLVMAYYRYLMDNQSREEESDESPE